MSKRPVVRFDIVDYDPIKTNVEDDGNPVPATSASKSFQRAISDFRLYSMLANRRVDVTLEQYEKLSTAHRNLISDCYPQHLTNIRDAIDHNQTFLNRLMKETADVFGDDVIVTLEKSDHHNGSSNAIFDPRAETPDSGLSPEPSNSTVSTPAHVVTEMQGFIFDDVQKTLRQFIREWSAAGAEERKACYGPVIKAVEQMFSNSAVDKKSIRILVPGSGLSRLAWELARRGYNTIANENSPFMLMGSYYALNCCSGRAHKNSICPWATCFSNNRTCQDQLECIQFPDVCAADEPNSTNLSVLAGDFTRILTYSNAQAASFDCVATCFFIDMASNILEYVEIIYTLCKPGGYWVNLGPLLYQSDYVAGQKSLELPYDVLKKAIIDIGFRYEQEEFDHRCPYIGKTQWMMRKEYNCIFFVCRKPSQTV